MEGEGKAGVEEVVEDLSEDAVGMDCLEGELVTRLASLFAGL